MPLRILLILKILLLVVFQLVCIKAYNHKPMRRVYRHHFHRIAVSKELSDKFINKAYSFHNYYLKNTDGVFIPTEEEIGYFKTYAEATDSFFKKLLPIEKFNGGIVVAKQGKIIYERYSGIENKEKNVPITENTSFHIASVSKTFTAMIILKLEEEKKLSIDDLVLHHLPDFTYDDITIRDLLNHRSGLNGYDNFMDNYWGDKSKFSNNMDVLININVNPTTKIFPAKKRFFYSNSNYAILALIVEKITGLPFKEYMNRCVFTPLQMTKTYVFSLVDTVSCTPSYDARGRKERLQYLDAIYGDKNVYTTVRDLLRWDLALYNPSFFSQTILKKAFQPYSFERNTIENYGLGWRMKYLAKSDKFIPYHYGWWHGNRSMFIRDIENKITIIILSNKLNKNMYRSLELVDILSKLDS